MGDYAQMSMASELETLNRTLALILIELEKMNRTDKPVKILQQNIGPAVKHGNNYNCGDGTGCKCGEG